MWVPGLFLLSDPQTQWGVEPPKPEPFPWSPRLVVTVPPRLPPAAEPVDVLKVLGVRGGQAGVPVGPGLCPQRAPEGDRAFRVGKASTLGVPTRELFPGESRQEGLGITPETWVTLLGHLSCLFPSVPSRWALS